MTGIPDGHVIVAIRIEGLGDGDGFFYYCTEVPRFAEIAGDDRFKPVIWHDPEPDADAVGLESWSESGNFQTGHSTIASMAIRLLARVDVWQDFHYCLRPVAIDILGQTIPSDPADPDYDNVLFDGGAPVLVGAGDAIWVGRECIKLGTDGGGGLFNLCTRGYLGTPIQEHNVPAGPDEPNLGHDIAIYARWITPQGRRITLGYWEEADAFGGSGTENDFVPLWAGSLEDVGSVDAQTTITLQTEGLGIAGTETSLYADRWQGVVVAPGSKETDPTTGLSYGTVPIVKQRLPRGDTRRTFPRAMGDNPVAGAEAWVRHKSSAFVLILIDPDGGTYELATERPLDFLEALEPDQVKRGDEVWEVLSSHPDSPWPGGTPSFTSLPLGHVLDPQNRYGDALTILLQVLTSTSRGDNGPYDIGIQLGIGMPYTTIDIDDIEELRGEIGGRLRYDHLHIGTDAKPDKAKEWIERHLLAPFGLMMALNDSQLWTVKYLDDLPRLGLTVPTLTDDDLYDGVHMSDSLSLESTVDSVVLNFQGDAAGDTTTLQYVNETNRERRLTGTGPLEIDAIGIAAVDQAGTIAQVHTDRWREILPPFEFSGLLRDRIQKGDPFYMTSGQLPGVDESDPLGLPVVGIENVLCYITALTTHLEGTEPRVDYKAIEYGLGLPRLGRLCFGLEVASGWSYTPGTGVVKFTTNLYNSPKSDGYAYDVDVEPVLPNFELMHMDQYLDIRFTPITVQSVNTGTSEITFAPGYPAGWDGASPPVTGDLFQSADYGDLTVTSQEEFVHQSDGAGTLPGGDPPYYWTR